MNTDTCPECKGTGIRPTVWTGDRTVTATNVYIGCSNCDGEGYLPRCAKCGELLQHVRPGKWQCVNEHK